MELNKIRDIIINFTQRDWRKEEFESALHFAQMKYYVAAVQRGDDLYKFKVKLGDGSPPLSVTAGEATIPTDYYMNVSMNVPIDGYNHPVRPCDDGQFDYLRDSKIEYPTLEYPICNFQDGTIRFLPKTIQYVNWTYYSSPVPPVFVTKSDRGFVEYDATGSVQLNWTDPDIIFIIQIFLQDLGIIRSVEEIKEKADAT